MKSFRHRIGTSAAGRARFASIVLFIGCGLLFMPVRSVTQQAVPVTVAAAPSVAANPLDSLLRARKLVEQFFDQSSNVVCDEFITQSTIGKTGKANYREESRYQYQLQSSNASGSLKLKETRDARKVAFRDPNKTLLITNGFTSILLILHPDYEASYQFENAGEQLVDGRPVDEIHFKAIPGGKSPAAMQLRGKNYPLPLNGSIWIDKESGAITRLTAAVDDSLGDLGLKGLSSDIHYALVQFHDPEESYWMPLSATIDLETPMQHWRNVHRFTGYKRFRATIKIELGKNE